MNFEQDCEEADVESKPLILQPDMKVGCGRGCGNVGDSRETLGDMGPCIQNHLFFSRIFDGWFIDCIKEKFTI